MGLKEFFLKKAIWKGVRRAAQVTAGFAGASSLKYFGVSLTQEQEAALVISVTGILEGGLNALKQKLPSLFGWL